MSWTSLLYTGNEAHDIISSFVVTTNEEVKFTGKADAPEPDLPVLGIQ